ncbi:MAG: thiosulfate reductase PhsA, partial [Deferribacteraceae bacterium]|nr:thiosulfate reductase PhsA [Deferribacteraceae bacterium]
MKVSRRKFIAGAVAACAAGGLLPGALALQNSASVQVNSVADSVNTTCEMCSFRCPVRGQVLRNGKVFLTGNANSSGQKTRICARGSSGYSLLKDPKRIVQPMKRTGARGAGEWQVISWETAYKEIAEKLQAIKNTYGAESVVFSAKSGSLYPQLVNFAKVFGSPNTFSHISTCPGGRSVAANFITGGDLAWDLANTKYLVLFGHNLYEGLEVGDAIKQIDAQAAGAKIVSFEPRLSIVSSKADEYFYIKPGMDIVVALAMCHVLIREGLYDKAFIERYTTGFEQFVNYVQTITPEYAQELSGVAATDIVRIAKELGAAAPSAIVSPGHRTTFSYEEFDTRRVLFALNVLLGNIDRKGGMYKKLSVAAYNNLAGVEVAPVLKGAAVKAAAITAKRIDQLDPSFAPIVAQGGIYQSIFNAAISEKPYPVKGWFMMRTNPLQTVADRPKMLEAIDKMELIISCDVYMTDSAAYADYFLPECTYLERYEDITDRSGMAPAYSIRQPLVHIVGNTKPSDQIFRELATELGLGDAYPWKSMEDIHKIQVGDNTAFYEELKKAGWLAYGVPVLMREPAMIRNFIDKYPAAAQQLGSDGTFSHLLKFNTPSGKIEFFSQRAEDLKAGYGLPRFRNISLKADDELFFIQGKTSLHTNGATVFVPRLAQLMSDNPVWIHPETAAKYSIEDGDEIYLENSVGKEKGR